MPKTPQIPPHPRNVVIVAFANANLLDIAGPLQVFRSANAWAGGDGAVVPYAVGIVAPSAPAVLTSAGVALSCAGLTRSRRPIDTLLVAGGMGVHDACCDRRLIAWVAQHASVARRAVSICTGAFLLATCGLLDGRRAVTHWMDCAELARRFPAVHVETDPIFIEDGPVWTSAGVTAGIDLALALVERDLGHGVAMAVARDLVVYLKRPGGQAQFSAVLQLQSGDARFDRLHGWIAGHLAQDLSVGALADRAGMSERSFIRHYGKLTGSTPARAVERMRVAAAQDLLATTGVPVKRVAQRCGFGSEETMRRCFIRQIGVTPSDYRQRFRQAASEPA